MTLKLNLNNRWFEVYFQRGNRFGWGRDVHIMAGFWRHKFVGIWTAKRKDGLVLRVRELTLDFNRSLLRYTPDSHIIISQPTQKITHFDKLQKLTLARQTYNQSRRCILFCKIIVDYNSLDILLLNCLWLIKRHYCSSGEWTDSPVHNIHQRGRGITSAYPLKKQFL